MPRGCQGDVLCWARPSTPCHAEDVDYQCVFLLFGHRFCSDKICKLITTKAVHRGSPVRILAGIDMSGSTEQSSSAMACVAWKVRDTKLSRDMLSYKLTALITTASQQIMEAWAKV
jgi:hypothetical protein